MAAKKSPGSRVLLEAQRLARKLSEAQASARGAAKAEAVPRRAAAKSGKKPGAGTREKIVSALKKLHPMD